MFKVLKTLILIIWIIDICNIDFVINGIHVAEFLDVTVPLNTLFWIILWILIPSSNYIVYKNN
jgi:hypothetical protein